MRKVQTQGKVNKVGDIFENFLASFEAWQGWQSCDITFLTMSKVQTQGKVSKVGDTFELIWRVLRLGKVGKVEI